MNYPNEIGYLKFKDGTYEVNETLADIPPSIKYVMSNDIIENANELLEALEAYMKEVDNESDLDNEELHAKCRAAIAKAKGETA